ncbi:MAG: C2 family cysteine protease [Anaerolineales bacterium]
MSEIIHMDSEQVLKVGKMLSRLSEIILGVQTEVSRAADGMDWTGSGRDYFRQDVEIWAGKMYSLSQRCTEEGSAVTKEEEEWEDAAAKFGWGEEGYTPFLVGENENTGPDRSDIDQESIGDCYLLSSLGSIAQNHPEVIEDMIEILPDGRCRVRFYDKWCLTLFGPCTYIEHWVTVDMDFPPGHALPADTSGGSQEAWTLIIEKAYLQWQKENGLNPILDLPLPAVALSAITGKDSTTWLTPGMSFDDLYASFKRGDAMTAGALLQIPPKAGNPDSAWPPTSLYPEQYQNGTISTDHVYFITNVDPVTQEVTLQNPWSSAYPPIKLPFDEYKKLFPLTMTNPVV